MEVDERGAHGRAIVLPPLDDLCSVVLSDNDRNRVLASVGHLPFSPRFTLDDGRFAPIVRICGTFRTHSSLVALLSLAAEAAAAALRSGTPARRLASAPESAPRHQLTVDSYGSARPSSGARRAGIAFSSELSLDSLCSGSSRPPPADGRALRGARRDATISLTTPPGVMAATFSVENARDTSVAMRIGSSSSVCALARRPQWVIVPLGLPTLRRPTWPRSTSAKACETKG